MRLCPLQPRRTQAETFRFRIVRGPWSRHFVPWTADRSCLCRLPPEKSSCAGSPSRGRGFYIQVGLSLSSTLGTSVDRSSLVMTAKESPPHGSRHGPVVTTAAASTTSTGQAFEYFKTKAIVPVLLVVGVQALATVYAKWHVVEAHMGNMDVDTTTVFIGAAVTALLCVAYLYNFLFTPGPVLMLDFACYKPHDSTKITRLQYMERAQKSGFFSARSLDFQEKVLGLSGLGDETYVPPSTLVNPMDRSLKACHAEAQEVLFGVADEMFAQGTVTPQDVHILVVNCSMYSPVPSLAAMLVNRYKMRKDIEVFNLGGMGCSAGLLSLDLARRLLQGRRDSYALVLSTEVISAMLGYAGDQRSMLVGNCLFRTGASGVLLSNRRVDRWRAKYELQHLVRTHGGADDTCYNCVRSEQDEAGNIGVSLSRELMRAAGTVLKDNITTLAPKILPWSEKLKFVINYLSRRMKKKGQTSKAYVPDFTKAVSHFAVHPGGRAILDGVAERLALSDLDMEPSRMTLHRFGNASSSSVWYVMAYLEAKDRVKRGDTIWQIALGSGLKCNSAVWKSLRSSQRHGPSTNVWATFIDKYPMELTPVPPAQPPSGSADH